jgi:hypothetical protein
MRWWMILPLFVLAACTREEAAPAPTPTPASALSVATLLPPTVNASPAPSISGSPSAAAEDAQDEDDEEEKPSGTDFEISADASSYSGYVPKTVALTAHALNGTPPFTYVWTFDDGAIPVAGDSIIHTFTTVGKHDVFVVGRDATGAVSRVQLVFFFLTPEEWARRHQQDPATMPSETPWTSPTPDPTPLPPELLAPLSQFFTPAIVPPSPTS